MIQQVPKKYRILRNIITSLDILLALLIIIFSQKLIGDSFGIAALTFGFIMLTIVTFLLVLQKL